MLLQLPLLVYAFKRGRVAHQGGWMAPKGRNDGHKVRLLLNESYIRSQGVKEKTPNLRMVEKEIWHSTFYQAPGFIIRILPACGFIWICLSITPPSFLELPSYCFSLFPPIINLSLASPPLFWLNSPPPPSYPIIYLPFLPLSISPSLTSCFPSCQTVIINGENDSPPGPREPSTLTALRESVSIHRSLFPSYLKTWPMVHTPLNASLCSVSAMKHDLTHSKKHTKWLTETPKHRPQTQNSRRSKSNNITHTHRHTLYKASAGNNSHYD